MFEVIIIDKYCKTCGALLIRRDNESISNFNARSHCGLGCREHYFKHGKSSRSFTHPIYDTWRNMKRRCYYPNSKYYINYGGRGITVCDMWRTNFDEFYQWAINNGWQKGLTIDRINVNGNYEPSNCRWITQKQQLLNRRTNRFITYRGVTKTATEWAESLGISRITLLKRLRCWDDLDRVMTEPIHESQRRERKAHE